MKQDTAFQRFGLRNMPMITSLIFKNTCSRGATSERANKTLCRRRRRHWSEYMLMDGCELNANQLFTNIHSCVLRCEHFI